MKQYEHYIQPDKKRQHRLLIFSMTALFVVVLPLGWLNMTTNYQEARYNHYLFHDLAVIIPKEEVSSIIFVVENTQEYTPQKELALQSAVKLIYSNPHLEFQLISIADYESQSIQSGHYVLLKDWDGQALTSTIELLYP